MDILLAEARARGLRVVPDDPGPEFRPVPFACHARPDLCGLCAVNACEHGETPGLRGAAARPRRLEAPADHAEEQGRRVEWPGLGSDVFRDYADLWEDMQSPGEVSMRCPRCGWSIVAPDGASAEAALSRHDCRGGAA